RSDGAATDKTCGIYLEYQNNSLIAYNEIDNSAAGGNINSKGELYGIYHGRANNAATKILYNKIKLLQDSTSNQADFFPIRCDIDSGNNASLTVSGNTITAIGGYGKRFAFVFQQGRLFNSEINSNVFQNNTIVAWDF